VAWDDAWSADSWRGMLPSTCACLRSVMSMQDPIGFPQKPSWSILGGPVSKTHRIPIGSAQPKFRQACLEMLVIGRLAPLEVFRVKMKDESHAMRMRLRYLVQ
jgi:hypothetical protein